MPKPKHAYVNDEGLRRDGRRQGELRRLNFECGVLPTADGSAVVQIGQTRVMAVIKGPQEVQDDVT